MDETLRTTLASLGITRCGVVPVSGIVFSEAFRASCESNQCGQYGKNWTCPPGVGEASELIAYAQQYDSGLVIQTVWPLEDMFDFEGMMDGQRKHTDLFRKTAIRMFPLLPPGRKLALCAGACPVCEICTYPSGEPCRFPERAMASLEAYGVDVAALISRAGLSYSNGPNTVSYVGLILY